MSLNTAGIELNNGLKALRRVWQDTREQWKDAVGRDFESRRWTPLETQVGAAVRAMDVLAPILAAARRECS